MRRSSRRERLGKGINNSRRRIGWSIDDELTGRGQIQRQRKRRRRRGCSRGGGGR